MTTKSKQNQKPAQNTKVELSAVRTIHYLLPSVIPKQSTKEGSRCFYKERDQVEGYIATSSSLSNLGIKQYRNEQIMSYGSGSPSYQRDEEKNRSGLSNRHSPYQNSTNYSPPPVSGSYAQQQTQVIEDSMRAHYETEATSAAVLSQMRTQRGQLQGAHDNVWEMRQAAEKAKMDISSMEIIELELTVPI
eukprot:scaffold349_cov267-Chaetoceros_neogracile.AAC.42